MVHLWLLCRERDIMVSPNNRDRPSTKWLVSHEKYSIALTK